VKKPPMRGPNANPVYTDATLNPMTCPRCFKGKIETRIACPVVLENADPIP
jgi:hypothetical protein